MVFNTYGRGPSKKGSELKGGEMVEENPYVTPGEDNVSMQSVQLEFTETRSDTSVEPAEPPELGAGTEDKDNLVEETKNDLDIRISFLEDADKDTAL